MEKFINKRLVEKELRLSEVARRIGISRQSLSESITKDMRVSTTLRIAESMGMQLGFFDPQIKKFHRITSEDLKK